MSEGKDDMGSKIDDELKNSMGIVPSPSDIDIDSGVSNGDVDWLFRGKASKKLAKKKPEYKDVTLNFSKQPIPKKDLSQQQSQLKAQHHVYSNEDEKKKLQQGQQQQQQLQQPQQQPPAPQSQSQSQSAAPLPASALAEQLEDLKLHDEKQPAAQPLKSALASVTKSSSSDGSGLGAASAAGTVGSNSGTASPASNSRPASSSGNELPTTSKILQPNRQRSSSESTSSMITPVHRKVSDPVPNGAAHAKNSIRKLPTINSEVQTELSRSNSNSKKKLFSSISSKFSKNSAAVLVPETGGQHTPQSNLSPQNSSPEQKSLFGIRRKMSVSKPQTPIKAPQTNVNTGLGVASGAPGASSGTQSPLKSPLPQVKLENKLLEEQNKQKKLSDAKLAKTKLRRVTFALDGLKDDPQQQIPSRTPKKGNVITPEEILAEPPRVSLGIVNANNTLSSPAKNRVDQEQLKMAYELQRQSVIEANKHAQEAHLAAQRMAKEVSTFRVSKFAKGNVDKDEEIEENVDAYVHSTSKVQNIDNPLHQHIDYFAKENDPQEDLTSAEESDVEDILKELPLDVIYTRCCHLREILPIPATLKQLKNKSKPLPVLKMLNPKPTLIDVLSFSDFIAITPIVTIIFDNVTLDTEMIKIILSSVSNSKTLEKLSLRNVALDSEGWLYLCKFLTLSKSLIKLDISQQKIKQDTPKKAIRSEMDWGIFTDSLNVRRGIDELVINGCKMTDAQFKHLIENGVSISTKRLGVAATNLNLEKCQILTNWIKAPKSTCNGVDIAFNDLSNGQLRPFIDSFDEKTKLAFFSLNSTNVTLEDCKAMIMTLSKLSNLRFLDLSNVAQIFPGIIPTLIEWLPKFPELRRIHFELDELTSPELVAISNTFPHCKNLIHVSFLGHKDINYATAVALYGAIKLSSVYTLDIDYDLIPEDLSSKIALYLMINMEKAMNKDSQIKYHSTNEELMFDGSVITQAAEKLLNKDESMNAQTNKKDDDLYTKEVITKALVEKTSRVRKEIHKQMDILFELRMKGKLSLEGKETLIRFCLLDNSLEKVVNIFGEEPSNTAAISNTNPTAGVNVPAEKEYKSLNEVIFPDDDLHLHKVSSDILETGPIVSPDLPLKDEKTSYFPNSQNRPPANTEQPRQVVVESTKEGKDIPVDYTTGKPVLFRKLSHTSEHAKKQEEEEGEFHRWGFFVQQQNSLFPGSPPTSSTLAGKQDNHKRSEEVPSLTVVPEITVKSQPAETKSPTHLGPKLSILPSGPELREAIIKAKGLQTVTDLIDRFNNDKSLKIEDLYQTLEVYRNRQDTLDLNQRQNFEQAELDNYANLENIVEGDEKSNLTSRKGSSSSTENGDISESPKSLNSIELDEAYDKLLNEVDKVRSNTHLAK